LAEHARTIGCLVLKDNPAVSWYRKCGYRVSEERPDHYKMELDLNDFKPSPYLKSEKELRP
jgi:ribosomal protein S18 acetylase RimI-like enzyme